MPKRFADFLKRLRGAGHDPDRDRLLAILGLNRELTKAFDRRQLLALLVDQAVGLFGAERGFLVQARSEAPGWQVEVARNLDGENVRNAERKVSSTVLTQAFAGEGVYSDDAQEGPLGASQSIADLKLRSVLCTPVRVGERVLGCIYLDHRFQSGAFVPDDVPWLQAFADQAAIAMHLHELWARDRERAEALLDKNQALLATVAEQAEELAALQTEVTRTSLRHPFAELAGESEALVRALHLLDRVAASDFSVLLVGESGTGKEVAARALHNAGPRRGAPFVPVNVAAISPTLLESELFGHSKGAFTGAERERAGMLREAQGGTLFLDEVTEMPLDLQVKLLRFLQDHRVRAVGGNGETLVDLRIVAATNREPLQAVAEGRLRADLYYRLAVVTVVLPPLRQRPGDVEILCRQFLAEIAGPGGEPRELPADVMGTLRARRWPGNLRQLKSEVQRLCALAGDGKIKAAMLSTEEGASQGGDGPTSLDLGTVEQWAIARAMAESAGNKALAARLLGISRRTLYSKLGGAEPTADDA